MSTHVMCLFCACALIACSLSAAELYPPMQPPFVEIVQGGKARCVIMASRETGEAGQWAAGEIQSCLKKMSGAETPIQEKAEGDAFVIHIARDASLQDEQLRIRSDGQKEAFLAGGGDRGVLYAACAFLEECLGVRWFMPTDYGEVVPQSPTIRVGKFDRTEQPAFHFRWIGNDQAWAAHNRMNVSLPIADLKLALPGHTFDKTIPPEKYFKEHLDWFAYRRETKERRPTQLCTSNPELVAEVVRNLRAILDADPEVRIIGLCPNDGCGFCECDACMALDEPGHPSVVDINQRYVQLGDERRTALGRRFLIFYNQVAKALSETHPRVIVRAFAYNAYLAPPSDEKLRCEPNLMIQICHNTCHNHPFGGGDCPLNAEFRRNIDGWARICRQVGFYEYYAKGASMNLPWPVAHCVRADIPYLHEHSGWGFYTQWSKGSVLYSGLNFYLAAKLVWNPRLSVDALFEDFFNKFYGPAAEPMRRIFDRLEDRAARSALHAKGSSDCKYLFVTEWFDAATLDPCRDDIVKARTLTNNPLILRRIEPQEALLEYARLMREYMEEIQRLHKTAPEGRADTAEAAKRAQAVHDYVKEKADMGLRMDKYTQTYLKPNAALNRLKASIAGPW